jgi:hypothetical protein
MSKVTIGHDSCSTWICNDKQGPSSFNEIPFDSVETGTFIETGPAFVWPLVALVSPIAGIYFGAKAASKAIRSSR